MTTPDANAWRSRDLRTACLLGAAAALTFALLGPLLHPAPGLGGEADGYDGTALRMANGLEAGDPYHPYGVPLLILAVMQCGLGPFAAGRVVAALAASVLVFATHLLLRRVAPTPAALLATLAVATTEITFVNAQLASSDMPAAAFVALTLLAWCRAADRDSARAFAFGCVAFGLALACRPSSLFVAAGALPLLFAVPWRRALGRALLGAAGVALGLAPHWIAQRIWGAGPPHPGNVANLVLKYRLGFDYDRIGTMSEAAIHADLREHWAEYLQRGLGDVWQLFTRDLAFCVAVPPVAWLTTALALLLTAALLLGLVTGDRGARVLALAGLAYGALLGFTFLPVDRMLLPLLPALLPLLLGTVRGRARPALAIAAATLLTTLLALPAAVQRFAHLQLTEPLAAMQELLAREGRPLIFVSDVARATDVPGALVLVAFPGWRGRPPADQVAWLRDQVERSHPDYVVYTRARSAELLANVRAELPAGWTIERDDAVCVLRVPPPDLGDWNVTVVRRGDDDVLSFRVPPLAGSPKLAHGAFAARAADGKTELLPATPLGDGAFEVVLPPGSPVRGEQQLTPVVLAEPGGYLRGAPFVHTFAERR